MSMSFEGYAMVKVTEKKGWKKRWCVLRPNDNSLYYYKTPEVFWNFL